MHQSQNRLHHYTISTQRTVMKKSSSADWFCGLFYIQQQRLPIDWRLQMSYEPLGYDAINCNPVCVCVCGFQLTVVVERIMAFSLASPLAKFLNGLEILLSKAQVSSVSKVPHVPYMFATGSVDTFNQLENKSVTILTADIIYEAECQKRASLSDVSLQHRGELCVYCCHRCHLLLPSGLGE